jgi:3-demethoxyubiquinol 3-hydroxylase
MSARRLSRLDDVIGQLDQALRMTFHGPSTAQRPNPADGEAEPELTAAERELSGRLMRVNHVGEICAQALYWGQSLMARSPIVQEKMKQAAREENDHLAWTEDRIKELGTHPSYLNPLWYSGAAAIGALAGLAGDRWNLGFIAETENQVVEHLSGHLDRLSPRDIKSKAILEQMREDEGQHATTALKAGASELPRPVKQVMKIASKIMTTTAYWI